LTWISVTYVGNRKSNVPRLPQIWGRLPDQLLKELNGWRGKIEEEVKTIHTGRTAFEIGAGIDAFFSNTGLKMKLEPVTRMKSDKYLKKT